MNVSEVRNEEGSQKVGQLSRKEDVTAQHFVLRVKNTMVSLFFPSGDIWLTSWMVTFDKCGDNMNNQ